MMALIFVQAEMSGEDSVGDGDALFKRLLENVGEF